MILLVGFIENDFSNAFKFGTDAEHAFDAALLFGHAEEGQEIDHLVHEFDIGASAGILGVLQDVGEQGDK